MTREMTIESSGPITFNASLEPPALPRAGR